MSTFEKQVRYWQNLLYAAHDLDGKNYGPHTKALIAKGTGFDAFVQSPEGDGFMHAVCREDRAVLDLMNETRRAWGKKTL